MRGQLCPLTEFRLSGRGGSSIYQNKSTLGVKISKQARTRFVLGMQGLWPGRRWKGHDGARAALQQCRIVRVDPLDVVGRAHDLALLSRVIDYRRIDLDRLLYEERGGFEHGGAVSIYPRELLRLHWSWVKSVGLPIRWEDWYAKNSGAVRKVKNVITARGPLGTAEWVKGEKVENYRSSKLEGLALYYLWRHFDVLIHHREDNRKYYDLTERMFGRLPEPLPKESTLNEMAFETMSRLGLSGQEGVPYLRTGEAGRGRTRLAKRQLRQRLIDDGRLAEVEVEGERVPAVVRSDALKLLEDVAAGEVPRPWRPLSLEDEAIFLAPIDVTISNGRSKLLFGFEYLWEVYKPANNRRWGYYVLPILCGDRLVGRVEPVYDRKEGRLRVMNAWWESGVKLAEVVQPFARGLGRLAAFVGTENIVVGDIGPTKYRDMVIRRISPTN